MWNWTEERLDDLMHEMWEMSLVLTASKLEVFDCLDGNPLTAEEVAEKLKASLRGVEMVLNALVGMGILQKNDGIFSLKEESQKKFCKSAPKSHHARILLAARLWKLWSHLPEVVMEGKSARDLFDLEEGPPHAMADFSHAMAEFSRKRAGEVAQKISHLPFRSLLDVGAGPATYTIAFLQALPKLKATIFDRGPVVEVAKTYGERAGLLDRMSFVAGDFLQDDLPTGHDLIYLSSVVHIGGPEENQELFDKCHQALEPGGALLIRDFVLDSTKTKPRKGAVFAVNMLVCTPNGRNYNLEELEKMLTQSGFENIELLEKSPEKDSLLLAYKNKG